MTAPLSYTDQKGYYGLRVNPSYEVLLGTVRKPLRIPLPDRSAKWYATGPYRALILDASNKYNDYEHMSLDYDQTGNHLPRTAAHTRPSQGGEDPVWDEHEARNHAIDEHEAYNVARQALEQERMAQARDLRFLQLGQMHGSDMRHPTIMAHHADLETAGVRHFMPAPKARVPRRSYPGPTPQFAAGGVPQAPEFPTFESMNMAQELRSLRPAPPISYKNVGYESMRDDAFGGSVYE